jgi:PAS domain S-box-containing protein
LARESLKGEPHEQPGLASDMTAAHDLARDRSDALNSLLGGEAFRLLVDAVEDYAIFLLSTEGRVLSWNYGARRIKGYTAEEIIGQHFSVFYTLEEREAGRPMRLLGWAAEHGRFEDEGWRVRKDGTRFWADVIVTALRDENGAPYAYAKVTRDLTERRASEERRRQLLAEQRARAAAEEALAARDRFLSVASHELKTPVASLRLAAESLLHAKGTGRLDEERLQTGLDRIVTASQRLGVLVAELLDISRLTAGVLPISRAPTDVVTIAREVIDRYADAGIGGRVTLTAPPAVELDVDASRLDQVLTNLVDNALKYSEPPSEIDVTISERPDEVDLIVADRGMGISEVTAERMFEAFGRGEGVEHVAGIGLGLHISQQIVARHGGTITAAPREDGPGAVFTIRLPRTVDTGA